MYICFVVNIVRQTSMLMTAPCMYQAKVEMKLNPRFSLTNAWSKRNKMGIHYKKTTCMTVGTKQKLSYLEVKY